MPKIKSTTFALLMLLTLAACGQTGPLYIPGNPSTIQPPAEPADGENDNDEDREDSGGR